MRTAILAVIVFVALAMSVTANGNGAGGAAPEPAPAFDTLCDPDHSNYTVRGATRIPTVHAPVCTTEEHEINGLVEHLFLMSDPGVSADELEARTTWVLNLLRQQNEDATVEDAFAGAPNMIQQPWESSS